LTLLDPISAGERPQLGDFYLRRLFRILPTYWVVLAIYVLIPSAREHDELAAPLVRFLTFTQNLGQRGGAFAHAWSLCIEEQFYLVLPLLTLTLAGRVRARTIGVLAIAIVLAGIVVTFPVARHPRVLALSVAPAGAQRGAQDVRAIRAQRLSPRLRERFRRAAPVPALAPAA
jgi:peptidoglycan/LPS O-acetylase OafA/YrhL